MKPSEVFAQHRDTIRRIVLESGMTNPRIFGSVLHGDEVDGSDLDLLIDVPPRTGLLEIALVQVALEQVVGVKVDLLTPEDLPLKFRSHVLAEAVPV
jgi:predicted nucleotidyltransferase